MSKIQNFNSHKNPLRKLSEKICEISKTKNIAHKQI